MKHTETTRSGQWILEFTYWEGNTFCSDPIRLFDRLPIIVFSEWQREEWEVGTVYVLEQEYGRYVLWRLKCLAGI